MTTPGGDRVRLRRAVFAQPSYRRLWAARTASQWGDVFATVALSLLVLDLTGSALGSAPWSRSRSCRCCCSHRWTAPPN